MSGSVGPLAKVERPSTVALPPVEIRHALPYNVTQFTSCKAEPMEDHIIQARDIFKTYTTGSLTVRALRGVDLSVGRGEIVAIMGPSGCGKTTLLNCLSGLDEIDSGRVLIDGMELHNLPDDERSDYRARRMGFVFQLYNLLPVLSAVENVEMPLLLSGVPSAEARSRAKEMLDSVGLTDRATHLPGELSGGQRQRVTIARALVNRPAIVWADEPTGDLDSETAGEIIDLLCGLNRDNGQSFVVVTHSPDVGQRAHRIVMMRDGLIEDSGGGSAQTGVGSTNEGSPEQASSG